MRPIHGMPVRLISTHYRSQVIRDQYFVPGSLGSRLAPCGSLRFRVAREKARSRTIGTSQVSFVSNISELIVEIYEVADCINESG